MDPSENMLDGLLVSELNRMAENALLTPATKPSSEEIAHWMTLFQYTHVDAAYLLTAQLNDVTRQRIPDSHWELLSSDIEASGYSRDSYEHLFRLKDLLASQSAVVMDKEGKVWTLVRLEGLFRSVERVKEIVGLEDEPVVSEVEGEMGMGKGKVVWLDEKMRGRIEEWINQRTAIAWKSSRKDTEKKAGPF